MAARIELVPTLEHCVETTAKQEFTKAKDDYLRKRLEDKDLEDKIELLRMFLETTDFRKLRGESEELLIKGKAIRFVLYLEEEKLRYEMKVEQ